LRGLFSWRLRRFEPAEPESGLSVARHPPVAARRQTDRADLGSVGQARTLELIAKEAAQEHLQPLPQLRGCVRLVGGRLLGEVEHFFRRLAVAQEVEEKEVVQLVGADDRFGYLTDLAVGSEGEQLRGNLGGDDV